MSLIPLQRGRLALACLLTLPVMALADGVAVVPDAVFPSNRFTVPDFDNATQRRVQLPLPDCAQRPSDCADVAVINTLDGFSTQPRITVTFTGDIDPASVSSDSAYLLNLGDVLTQAGRGQRVGINQAVWDPASKTLAFESDALLQERSRYLLVLTNGLRDARGKRLKSMDLDRWTASATRELRDALPMVRGGGQALVGAAVFTTQTSTGDLLKVQRQIKAGTPAPIDFMIGNGGSVRAVFPVGGLTAIQISRDVGTNAPLSTSFLPTPLLGLVPNAVSAVAYGRFSSPRYQNAANVIPATPTLTGAPQAQGSASLVVQVFLPNAPKPAAGWPVAIFGHGFTDSMFGAPWTVASVLASQGFATVAINVVGHGFGPRGVLTVLPTGGLPVQVPAGGRGVDQNGDGVIGSTEGVDAAPPQTIVSSRDALRQTVIDLMQLVRQMEQGVDVDGDGSRDLDPGRIHYAGQSFGGIYGTMLMGVEPRIVSGVLNVPGGSITEVARLGAFRVLTGLALLQRQPSLLNLPSTLNPLSLNFNENMPLRNLPVVVNTVPGALAIAELLDRNEWVQQAGNPVSYAPLIRLNPPAGQAPKPVLLQVAKGDQTVPNPTSTAIARAGGLEDRVAYFRNDLAVAVNPAFPKNPHTYLNNLAVPSAQNPDPQVQQAAVAAQLQLATFLSTNGQVVLDPDGTAPLFEVPIQGPLPEVLNYLP